jgi:transposase
MTYFTNKFLHFKGYLVQGIENTKNETVIRLSPRRKTASCPRCGERTKTIYEQGGQRKIKHSKYEGRLVSVTFPKRRFTCSHCSRPFSEQPEFVAQRARTTGNFALEAIFALSRSSFSTVCESYQTSYSFLASTLLKIKFDDPWPKGELRLGFDEHAYGKRHMMITVCELKNHKLLAILPYYTKEEVVKYLDSRAREELGRVTELCFDMGFKQQGVVEGYFPSVFTTVDKFHVLFCCAKLIDADRRILCTKYGYTERENLRQIMRMPTWKLTEKQREFLSKVFNEYPELKERWSIYQKLARFYQSKNREEGRLKLTEIRKAILDLGDSYLASFAKTLRKREEEILNYFVNHTTNAYTEGVHTKIKMLKRTSYGFKNINIYIKKMMLSFLPFVIMASFFHPTK